MSPHDDQVRRFEASGPRSVWNARSIVGAFFATSNGAASGFFASSTTNGGTVSNSGDENVTTWFLMPGNSGGHGTAGMLARSSFTGFGFAAFDAAGFLAGSCLAAGSFFAAG